MSADTPEQVAARDTARQAADDAAARASGQVASAHRSMAAAVASAERANQAAAGAIDALAQQLGGMSGAASAPSSCPVSAPPPPPAGSGEQDDGHHHGWLYNASGGFGDAAWGAGPGLVGDLVGLVPTDATHGFKDWVQSGHDGLSTWYGADEDSGAYTWTDGGVTVATFFIPGEGWVKGAQAATKADDALRLGDQVLTHTDDAARALEDGSAGRRGAGGAGGGGERLPWTSWQEYPKVERDGKEHAQIGDRLYSHHAVDRMQPSGLGAPAGATGAGRSVSPNHIEDILQNTRGMPVEGPKGEPRLSFTSGSVQVITEDGIIITVITR